MASPLISSAEIASLAEIAESAMLTLDIQIFHKVDVENSFSDDGETYPDDPDETVQGWLRVQPDFDLTDAFAVLQHIEDGRLFVPRTATMDRGDKVVVNGEAYSVVDVNTNNTYRVLTRASLRRMD